MDAIEKLLAGRPGAEKLLEFHWRNREFLPRMAAEFLLLKRSGQRSGGADAVFHYLRWAEAWHGADEFALNDHLAALAARVCVLLWPEINGMMRFVECDADLILGTSVGRKRGYGNVLKPTPALQFILNGLTPAPELPKLDCPRTIHELITFDDAAKIIPWFVYSVAATPSPGDPVLLAWLGHVHEQPELFALAERTVLKRQPRRFSALSVVEYSRWSVRRAARNGKRFSLPSKFDGLYTRALILRNPQFNGLCKFKDDGTVGRANRLLGTSMGGKLAGEPYRRLVNAEESVGGP
jgi:hypothetical protein